MIDYKAIIDNLTIEHVKTILDKLDIPYKDNSTYLVMPTYCHHAKTEEASWKLYYYDNNKIFVCYTDCCNMSIFKFLKNFYNSQDYDYDWYQDIYCLITESSNYSPVDGFTAPRYQSLKEQYESKQKLITLPEYNQGVLGCFVKQYPVEWLADGITQQAMDKFNIRFSIGQNKIIIPHYDEVGRLVGIRGRALNEWEIENLGKYMPVQIENTWYKHPLSMNLYGLYENKENIKQSGVVFVAEAEKSVLQAESFDRPNCFVAVCGSHFNKFALQKLMSVAEPREIVICFDKEELPGETKYFDKLMAMCRKYKNYAEFSFIYDRENLLQLKDSPTDKGEDVFRQLLARRVQVV